MGITYEELNIWVLVVVHPHRPLRGITLKLKVASNRPSKVVEIPGGWLSVKNNYGNEKGPLTRRDGFRLYYGEDKVVVI